MTPAPASLPAALWCPACRYDLSGIAFQRAEAQCPECGHAMSAADVAHMLDPRLPSARRLLRHLYWTLATLIIANPNFTFLSFVMTSVAGSAPLASYAIVFLATLIPVMIVWFLRDHVLSWVSGAPMPSNDRMEWYASWSLTLVVAAVLPTCGALAVNVLVPTLFLLT